MGALEAAKAAAQDAIMLTETQPTAFPDEITLHADFTGNEFALQKIHFPFGITDCAKRHFVIDVLG